jgi:uncharacterized membrane protein (TIGR02234 family)
VAERLRSRTFGPVVLAGLAGAGLSAMASHEDWVTAGACDPGLSVVLLDADAPAAGAVALALLASWGVVLVTRGRVRRAAAVVAALLSLGQVAAVVTGVRAARDGLHDRVAALGGGTCATDLTGWFWVAVVALPLAVLPALAAVRLVPGWPEMGRKYDAPAGQEPPAKAPEEQENLDLWKAMDEGRDPTA